MRIVNRIVASWGLGPMLALAGCSDDGAADPEAWDPGVTSHADTVLWVVTLAVWIAAA